MQNRAYDCLFQLCITGSSQSGKSCIFNRFMDDQYQEEYDPTIGINFKKRFLAVGSKNVWLNIWDLSGKPRYANITRSYFKGVHGAIIVYDCTSEESFAEANTIIDDAVRSGCHYSRMILVANKADIDESMRAVTSD